MNEGQLDSPQPTYRVVGVRADGARVTVEDGVSRRQAEELKQLLIFANAFRAVEIEPERQPD
jgi:hypothetical protein